MHYTAKTIQEKEEESCNTKLRGLFARCLEHMNYKRMENQRKENARYAAGGFPLPAGITGIAVGAGAFTSRITQSILSQAGERCQYMGAEQIK